MLKKRALLGCLLCLLATLVGLLLTQSPPEVVRYDRHALVRVHPKNEKQLQAILTLSSKILSTTNEHLDVVLSPEAVAALFPLSISHEILIEDIQSQLDQESARLARASDEAPFFSEYRNFEAILGFMDRLVAAQPELVRLEQIGGSVEGRPIRALKIAPASDKPRIVLNGGLHAREWIAVMVATCVADRLVHGAQSDARIKDALDRFEFVVVPILNPDGYNHSWSVDRLWRKNRRAPHGVDLNRNFAVGFGGRGSSGRKRSEIYRGPHAFSEPETLALARLLDQREVKAHIDFHSYGQLVLFPWSYTDQDAPDRARFSALADRMVTAMFVEHKVRYKMLAGNDLYLAGGTLADYSYGRKGAIAFTIELRPKMGRGGNGFILPPEQIVPTCDEGLAAVLQLTEQLSKDR